MLKFVQYRPAWVGFMVYLYDVQRIGHFRVTVLGKMYMADGVSAD